MVAHKQLPRVVHCVKLPPPGVTSSFKAPARSTQVTCHRDGVIGLDICYLENTLRAFLTRLLTMIVKGGCIGGYMTRHVKCASSNSLSTGQPIIARGGPNGYPRRADRGDRHDDVTGYDEYQVTYKETEAFP